MRKPSTITHYGLDKQVGSSRDRDRHRETETDSERDTERERGEAGQKVGVGEGGGRGGGEMEISGWQRHHRQLARAGFNGRVASRRTRHEARGRPCKKCRGDRSALF